MLPHARKSYLDIGYVFFWTSTINSWKCLLEGERYKKIILSSLRNLKERELITILGYVIMPNHIHLIWKLNDYNGKELPSASFSKFTAHQFQKVLRDTDLSQLEEYAVDAPNKRYEFWHRDPLAFHLYTNKMLLQKLNYIHNNPLQEKWQLCEKPEDYPYSSAKFYLDGVDPLGLVEHYEDHF